MEQFSNGAILKWSDSQMEQFSNGAILKWSDLGSPPYAIFQDPKNREIWHAMCYQILILEVKCLFDPNTPHQGRLNEEYN